MSYPLRSCHRCGKGFFSSYAEHICQYCLKDLGWEPTPYTNADHIRSMTDEELAKALDFTCPPGDKWKSCDDCSFEDSKKCWMEWLKQPYKEDV